MITYREFFGFDWDGWVYSFIELFLIGFYCFNNYVFVIAGLVDFNRRKIMMDCCSALINPLKNEIDSKLHIIPTINFIDQ